MPVVLRMFATQVIEGTPEMTSLVFFVTLTAVVSNNACNSYRIPIAEAKNARHAVSRPAQPSLKLPAVRVVFKIEMRYSRSVWFDTETSDVFVWLVQSNSRIIGLHFLGSKRFVETISSF